MEILLTLASNPEPFAVALPCVQRCLGGRAGGDLPKIALVTLSFADRSAEPLTPG